VQAAVKEDVLLEMVMPSFFDLRLLLRFLYLPWLYFFLFAGFEKAKIRP